MDSKTYWGAREAKAQAKITKRNTKETEKLLKKAYRESSDRVIFEFADLYKDLLLTTKLGETPTPADLYKLDNYWHFQNQLKEELEKLGQKQIQILSRNFLKQFEEVYNSINFENKSTFSTMSINEMKRAIDSIWCADGNTWSDRVWSSIDDLRETLQEQLTYSVSTGKKTSQLKELLMDRYNVSYHQADTITRTEMAHIQTSSAQQRYKDYGVNKMQIWAEDCQCEECKALNGKEFSVYEPTPVPIHPNCRCCVIPVIDE